MDGNSYYYNGYTPIPYFMYEKKQLKRTVARVSLTVILMLIGMRYCMSLLVTTLAFCGVLDMSQLSQPLAGLDSTSYLLLSSVARLAFMLLPLLIASLFFGRAPASVSAPRPLKGRDVFFGILVGMGVFILANYVANFILIFLQSFGVEPPEFPSFMDTSVTSLLCNLFALAVLPAVLEELAFRHTILRLLRPYGDGFAVLISALLFGLVHGNVTQVPFATIGGLALGWLYVKSDNLMLPITVHFANNALATVLEYCDLFLTDKQAMVFHLVVYALIVLIAVISVIILAAKRSELLRANPRRTGLTVGRRVGTMLTSVLFWLMTAMLIYQLVRSL